MPNEPALRLGAFAIVLIAMAAAEAVAPRRVLRRARSARWAANLALTALDTLVVRLVAPIGVTGIALYAHRHGWGLLAFGFAQARPMSPMLAGIIGFVVLDAAVYGQHVAMHRVPWLWRMHRVHHTDEDMDVTTGVRFHPFEIVISLALKAAIVMALGIPAFGVLLFEVVLNAAAMFNHANWRMPLGLDAVARLFIVTPDMHRVHHSVRMAEQNANYGFNVPWWDRLFKTYRAAPESGHENMEIGVTGLPDPRSIVGLLRLPMKRTDLIAGLAGALIAAATLVGAQTKPAGAPLPKIDVYKDPTCGCCTMWVQHLRKAGFTVSVTTEPNMDAIKDKYKVPENARSCHTAIVDGYVIEGHVPASDIKRLLAEKPMTAGLAAPGMPVGSPGMEGAGGTPYDILEFDKRGKTRVYSTQQPRTRPD